MAKIGLKEAIQARSRRRELAVYCGGLPLALEIEAARLSSDPGLPIADLGAQLAVSQARLSVLHYDDGGQDLSVRAAFDDSYRRLHPAPAELFCHVGGTK
ncbi:hypothetical protein OIA45_40695 (plasmid) [Streptomyces chartreusis]|uniref:hypothetical protein n=1 Tax=Streptomyces chartreusis TaxID=1969 RepID=UPI002F914A36|nr:hypothetical protein OIA45_40695 [Streptomyces chartreusis]